MFTFPIGFHSFSPVGGGSLLLDTYSGGQLAFSLRKVRNAYSGNCVRVRRSSDNAEQDVGFVDRVIDTASMLTFCGAGDGFVVTWYEQSGNGLNATQASNSLQPQIVTSGAVNTFGGKPSVDFNGSTSVLWGTDGGVLNGLRTGQLSYFAAARSFALPNYACIFTPSVSSSDGQGSIALQKFGVSGSIFGPHNTWIAGTNVASVDLTGVRAEHYIFSTFRDSAGTAGNGAQQLVAVRNGARNLSSTGTQTWTSNNGTKFAIGNQSDVDSGTPVNWDGPIQELLVFSVDHRANRAAIEADMAAAHGIAL